MSSKNVKCKNCGSSEIEVDSARGDAVCTNCGSVLEDNIIVSEVQFEEAHGASNAVGQFVSSDSKGGATGYGKFHVGTGTESREVTLRKAKAGITHLCHQLALNNHCIETACNFFKMALMRQLTRGRKNTHIYAACVYITCRTEGTSHLLIDISDVLQICCYELGRTYLKLSQALCINIPSIDPCIYIMRFANKLELGDKTHEVSMTAQRLVTRMKKDSIHSGRRPSGLCGASLLLAARMHDFNRTPNDIVRIVKIHESTLRKRLLEFGETPSSALTLDEFMSVDLEAEQDPPAFKAARKKDKERILKLQDADTEITQLQAEIEKAIEDNTAGQKRSRKHYLSLSDVEVEETSETNLFIEESTINTIQECLADDEVFATEDEEKNTAEDPSEKAATKTCPEIVSLCLDKTNENPSPRKDKEKKDVPGPSQEDGELDLTGIDDDELSGYIMTADEAEYKDKMWNQLNQEYLTIAKAREEKLAKEREEGKPEKKRRRTGKKKLIGPSSSAGEAIEKMLHEKKISNKINYDILKTLTDMKPAEEESSSTAEREEVDILTKTRHRPLGARKSKPSVNIVAATRRNKAPNIATIPTFAEAEAAEKKEEAKTAQTEDEMDETDIEPEPEPKEEHSSLRNMLQQDDEDGDDYYGYDEY
ncbi:transcription factor IIIB 90 kDa subunit [Culicoides brevitarsis]|uniref:transcription factor IIIB 90 kDa subunit n=1 Tax=Culicoides brevitarsis TaxID=469753 RepID=UPI00307BAEAD